MHNPELTRAFSAFSTAQVADACVRLGIPVRVAPPGIRSLADGQRVAGLARPVRHYGSVDVFLEALSDAAPGDVLVVDNGGRLDEGCIGDLIALECHAAELAAIVIWGLHRDTAEIRRIGIPLFSYGACPAGPLRVDERETEALESARLGEHLVTREDVVFADGDGVALVASRHLPNVVPLAREIAEGEQAQASAVQAGHTLRAQFQFDEYLRRRQDDPSYTFRAHLRGVGKHVEE
ncbi:MAG TPA: RraA family protein [Ardenticatenaceae bacterium]|nr:RraA family protein [Ardenticatenaceae bacterium]